MTSINKSAGILVYRIKEGSLEFLLVHPDGPYNRNKDLGIWTIPKGGIESGENIETAARREFFEETSLQISAPLTSLSPITMKSGKIVYAFAVNEDLDISNFKSNEFAFHGKNYPEVDRAEYFPKDIALQKIHPSQASFVYQIE